MPFPHQFGREESDRRALLEGLPGDVELVYTVRPWRTFDLAVEVDRVGKKLWLVFYSANYTQNFDYILTTLQHNIQFAFDVNF